MEVKSPANLGQLPRVMAKWAGRELACYQNMVRKYQIDESTFFASIPEGLPPLEQGETLRQ